MVVKLKILKIYLAVAICVGFLIYFLCAPWSQVSEPGKVIEVGNHLYNTQDLLAIGIKYVENLSRDNVNVTLLPSCGRYPAPKDLNISDTYWQVTKTVNGTFYLFNAYLDDRAAVNGTVVRILGLIDKIRPTVKTYCQLWFAGIIEPIPVEVHEYLALWPAHWGENMNGATPNLITCKNPFASQGLVPQYVSLVEDKCGHANNMLSVSNKRPTGQKKSFLVCWRGANFDDDISLQVVEWAEILKIFGCDTVVVYVIRLHENVMKVLDYYRTQGFFIVKFIKFPHEFPSEPSQNYLQWLQGDLVAYHDAFYEYLYQYEFMIPMDVDEFLMPLHNDDRTWYDLLRRTNKLSKNDKQIIDAYPLKNMYFILKNLHRNEAIEGIPQKFRFLSNIYRAANVTADDGGAKSFMRMSRVLHVHNHFPISCVNPSDCQLLEVETSVGHLSHYRTDCDDQKECIESMENPVKDTRLWKYKDELLKNVHSTLLSIGMD